MSGRLLSPEEFRKEQKLREQRQAGELAPETDEDGKDINPHIPQFIAEAPWYLRTDGPTLRHQRMGKEVASDFHATVARGFAGPSARKYRKGACENCGSMTHKRQDCTERPRPRKGKAKWSGLNIAPDEIIDKKSFDWDGKRDQWKNYDPSRHKEIVEKFERTERERKKIVEAEARDGQGVAPATAAAGDDELKVEEEHEMTGQKFDAKTRMSVRNLRIREDPAKYLLDLSSETDDYYDPKSRSLRADPRSVNISQDDFLRGTQDEKSLSMQRFALTAAKSGVDVPLVSNPTQAAIMHEKHVREKAEATKRAKEVLFEKYGGKEHLEAAPKTVSNEQYVEYSIDGSIIDKKASERVVKGQSKYEEDVPPLNHTSVWGSAWKEGKWGYACCEQFERNCYCTGGSRKRASDGESPSSSSVSKRIKEDA